MLSVLVNIKLRYRKSYLQIHNTTNKDIVKKLLEVFISLQWYFIQT